MQFGSLNPVTKMRGKCVPRPVAREALYWNGDQDFDGRKSRKTHWSVPWSDLMMSMFILFAVLCVYQSTAGEKDTSREKEASPMTYSPQVTEKTVGGPTRSLETGNRTTSDLYDLSRQTVKLNDLEHFASVRLVSDRAVRIILTGDLLFDTGKAVLKPEARHSLERIAEIIGRTSYSVNVVGHTDDVPIRSEKFPTNWELSAIRACEVTRFLIEDMGLEGHRFRISGCAYHEPVFENASPQDRFANRRVEIILTREGPDEGQEIRKERLYRNAAEMGQSKAPIWPYNTFQ